AIIVSIPFPLTVGG
ncbi:hypothetical protein A2U01_0092408, partial [Trifolium medium]|nr:hypothetical protein [Trifolium medium]